MKQSLIIFGLLSLFLVSCEKEIDIDLKESDRKVVIVGKVSNLDEPASVSVTRSVPFDEPNVFPQVTNASVTITRRFDGEETVFALVEVSPGFYQTTEPIGTVGARYTLSIETDDQTYEATSVMPDEVMIDDFYFDELFPGSFFPAVDFPDVAGRRDYYKADLIINNELRPDIFIADDTFTDGLMNSILFGGPDLEFVSGDTVRIYLDHIDESVFNYWFSMQQNVFDATAAPANPITNLSNGALGYFSAYTRTTAEGIVP